MATATPNTEKGSARFFVFKFAGIPMDGYSEDTEYVKNVRTVSKSSGGVDALVTWEYEPTGPATKMTLNREYIVPVPLIGKLAESVIAKMNEQEAETILENLKTRMEA